MELPLTRRHSSSRSTSTASTTTSSPGTNSPQSPLNINNDPFNFTHPHNHLHRVHYISHERTSGRNIYTNGGGSPMVQQNQPQPRQQLLWHQNPHHHHHHQYNQHHHPVYQCQPGSPGSPISEKSNHHKLSDSSSGHEDIWVRPSLDPPSVGGKSDQILLDGDDCGDKDVYKEESYVVFNKNKVAGNAPHEYSYPNLEPALKPASLRSKESTRKVTSSPSSHQQPPYPPLPIKNTKSKKDRGDRGSGDSKVAGQSGARARLMSPQVQCKNCRELFSHDNNPRGSCEDAPDSVHSCIECVSCVSCTSCLMYHCWADADGEFRHPCSCETGDPNHCKRWTALTFLSLIFPCLWCYLPLKACHSCGSMCGVCGGQHKAA